jgi:serine/threonine-protein kinase
MEELHWRGQERFSIVLDDRHDTYADIWLRPGDTIVGVVPKGIDPTTPQMKLAPPGTQFLGGKVYVWPEKTASGRPGRVVVKYERVKLPRQDEVPVCFVVDVGAPELKDGAARTSNDNAGFSEPYGWGP